MNSFSDFFYGMTRFAKVVAIVAAVLSMVAIVLTGKTQVLLFTGFAISCAFYTEELLSERDIAAVRAESKSTLAASH